MALHVTRCPHCQTSFRVRDEHLNAARGMVRCGSCLQVFKAAEHFIIDKKAGPNLTVVPKPETKTSAKPAVATAASSSAGDDDEFGLIHDGMDDEEDTKLVSADPFRDFIVSPATSKAQPLPDFDIELDESFLKLDNAHPSALSFVDPEKAGKAPDDDEEWANSLLDDDSDDVRNKTAQKLAKPKSLDEFVYDRPPPEEDDFAGFFDDELEIAGDHSISQKTLEQDDLDLNTIEIPVTKVAHLQHEPLQFEQPASAKAQRPWGWMVASLVMLLIAAAQTLYFNFDQWARSPQWRPFYAEACTLLNCQLPKVQNLSSMTTQHLVVRAHPQLQRALMVDTLLLNKADYEQPFPDLLLVFRDLNDRVVANRRFTPVQYLSGELAGQFDMPVKTPVHIALEIADPGPEAVSYAISLLANQ